jgi:hypothetical protein
MWWSKAADIFLCNCYQNGAAQTKKPRVKMKTSARVRGITKRITNDIGKDIGAQKSRAAQSNFLRVVPDFHAHFWSAIEGISRRCATPNSKLFGHLFVFEVLQMHRNTGD